jgi:hypothetical protein
VLPIQCLLWRHDAKLELFAGHGLRRKDVLEEIVGFVAWRLRVSTDYAAEQKQREHQASSPCHETEHSKYMVCR